MPIVPISGASAAVADPCFLACSVLFDAVAMEAAEKRERNSMEQTIRKRETPDSCNRKVPPWIVS